MSLSVAELVKRIEQGEDFESISRSLISPAERALLKCCAVVRTFDESLVNNYFQRHIPDSETVPFSKLITRDFVQRVPRSDGVYFLQPSVQKQYYDAWWESNDGVLELPRSEVPRALCELSASLVDYYASQGTDAKLDLLAQLVFVNRDEACRLFEELYKEADTAFDLARCRDLINVLTGRENVLGPEFSQSLNDTDRYLQSRTLWATEYYQTVSYYERKELKDELETFLSHGTNVNDPNRKWIFHLHAPGGMGKTMFVRWLISRRCVPQPYTIPCGRIDFDFVDRTTSSQHRWHLFLRMARALEVQIPGNRFHSLISRFTDYEKILNHAETQPTESATPTHLPRREKLEDEILYLFGTALKDANLGRPVILIFDTLEEVILYRPDDLLALVRQVNEVRKVYPDVLLILSGRYDLTAKDKGPAARLPEFVNQFGDFTQTVRIKPFAKDEALGFLVEKKKLTKDRPLDVVVEKSEGNPFKLALFADILLDDPKITADKIRDYPSADLAYLIERVLARIPNKKLHWLLRYGVVPRKLTRTFAEEVIKKHLQLRIAGDSSQDDPSRYESLTEKVHATVKEKKIFEVPGSAEQEINMDELWAELQNYASSYAWVTTEPVDANTVVFHGDVVNPMRRWLEKEPVYKLLHRDAISYFEHKAQIDPNDWVKWMRNAVYHMFQLEGAHADKYWRDLLRKENDPRKRRDLARELIGSEYVDDNLKPRLLLNDKPIISVSTLIAAYYESAHTTVEIARSESLSAGSQLWSEADYDLQKCEQLQKEYAEKEVSAADIASLRAAILTSQNRGEQAINTIENVLYTEMHGVEHLRLRIELAIAYGSLGRHQEAENQWTKSLALAKEIKSSPGVFALIYSRLARLHRQQDNLYASASAIESALGHLGAEDVRIRSELIFELADVCFEMGQFTRGKNAIETQQVFDAAVDIINQLRYSNYLMKFWLAAGDPLKAFDVNHRRNNAMIAVSDASRSVGEESKGRFDSLVVVSQELLGMAHLQLFEFEEAQAVLELARSRWRELGNTTAAQRCMLEKAKLWLSVVGDVKEAATTLNGAARLTIDYDAEQSLAIGLLSLKQFHLQNDEGVLKDAIDTLEKEALDKAWSARLRAKLLLGVGAYRLSPNNPKSSNEFFAELTGRLREVQPVSARLLLFDPLKEYPTCKGLDWKVVEDLLHLVQLDHQDQDFDVNAPKVAELLRVLGRKDAASSLLKELLKRSRGESTLRVKNLWLTRGRTSFFKVAADELDQFIEAFSQEFHNYPTLCAATLIELAELPYTTRSTSVRLRLLDQARELLQPADDVSQWMTRLLGARGKLLIERDREQALDHIKGAINHFTYLGNNLAATNLNNFVGGLQLPLPNVAIGRDVSGTVVVTGDENIALPPPTQPKPVIVHVADGWTESVKIRTTSGDEPPVRREVPIEPGTLLDRLLALDTYENYSFSFLRELDQNWIQTCTQMGPILIDDKLARQFNTNTESTALCLMIDALQLSSPPWEMMVMPSNSDTPVSLSPGVKYVYRTLGQKVLRNVSDIVWLQNALSRISKQHLAADGFLGLKTKQALTSFQLDHKLPAHGLFDGLTKRKLKQFLRSTPNEPRPRVLLLRPSIDRQRAASRGHEFVGFRADDSYNSLKFGDLTVVEDPTVKDIQKYVSGFKPDVIHIVSTVEESTSIGIYLDFATGGTGVLPSESRRQVKGSRRVRGDLPQDSVPFLSLSALGEIMRKYQKPDRARPLLILDILEPPGRSDLFIQLFLRNAFAAQLFAHGVFESIIAGGLTPPVIQEELSRTLVSGLAEFASVGDIVNRMRRTVDLGNYTRYPDVNGQPGPLRDFTDRDYLSTVVATAGISLFTQDPEM